jgi:hypothetical protein
MRDDRFLRPWAAAIGAACAIASIRPQYEGDLFWHRTLGRAVLQHHARVVPEPSAMAAFSDPAFVPEWLWGVVTYGFSRVAPRTGPAILVAILGALAAVLLVRLLRRMSDEIGAGAIASVSGLVMAVALIRLRVRPEAAAIALVPAFLLGSYAYADAAEKPRARIGAALVTAEILWAQLHGSFVLAPVIFALAASPALIRDARTAARSTHLAVLGGLALGLFTSAYGFSIFGYILAHAGGDATRHIGDMRAPTWDAFAPSGWLDGAYGGPYGASFAVLFLASLLGMAAARRVYPRELLLALFGLVLLLVAARFLPFAAMLSAPLAALGLSSLGRLVRPHSAWRWIGALAGLAAPALYAKDVEAQRGPLGKPGLGEGAFPMGAIAFLEKLPPGSNVLTSYDAGAPIGFWLGGRVRTYVDARTPLYFDDADFALSRDVFRDPDVLARALVRYDARAVVINRSKPVCDKLPPGWVPVVVEASFTTFARGAAPLTTLSPCGPDYLAPDACKDGGTALDAEIARLPLPKGSPFVRLLRAERLVRCGGPLDGVDIPTRAESGVFADERDHLEAAFRMRTGDPARAVDLLEDAIRAGDPQAIALVAPAFVDGRVPAARARALLGAAVDTLDDAAPPDLRALLALACAAVDEPECARFQGVRAAVRGSRSAVPALAWVAEHHPAARARTDAAAWLRVLAEEPSPPR